MGKTAHSDPEIWVKLLLKGVLDFLPLWQNLTYLIFKTARKSIDYDLTYNFLDTARRYLFNHCIALS